MKRSANNPSYQLIDINALQVAINKFCATKRSMLTHIDEFFRICINEDTPTRLNKAVELRKKWEKEIEQYIFKK